MKLPVLLFLSLFLLAGCYVPYLNYTPENQDRVKWGEIITIYADSTVDVSVTLPHDTGIGTYTKLAVRSNTDKIVYVKELIIRIIDDQNQKDVESKDGMFASGQEFRGSDYQQIPDSLKILKKQGWGVGMLLNFNSTNLKKIETLTLKCNTLIYVDGKKIVVDKTIPLHRNYYWNLYSGD